MQPLQSSFFKFAWHLCLIVLFMCTTTGEITNAHEGHTGHEPNPAEEETINIAMTAAFVSEKGIGVYQEIADYIDKKSGLHVEFVSGLSYATVNSMIESGAAQIAFVCGYPYVLSHDGKENPPIKLLAAPVSAAAHYKGEPKYYSYVIVRRDSPITKFEELKNKTWVYNDEISNSGYNMPRAKLVSIGQTEGFFGKVLKSGSHEESIRMVGAGQADASAVDSLVLDYALAEKEPYASEVKIIETLGPAGVPPVVYSSKLPEEKVQKIKKAFLEMKDDPEGKIILEKAHLLQFMDVTEENYNDIRDMAGQAQKANFMEIK
jgi:phosphonate transport system substrate-binding protein